jgi:hypothetical protein
MSKLRITNGSRVWTSEKAYRLSAMPPVRWSSSGASSSCDKVTAVIRCRENCSCSHATCINSHTPRQSSHVVIRAKLILHKKEQPHKNDHITTHVQFRTQVIIIKISRQKSQGLWTQWPLMALVNNWKAYYLHFFLQQQSLMKRNKVNILASWRCWYSYAEVSQSSPSPVPHFQSPAK